MTRSAVVLVTVGLVILASAGVTAGPGPRTAPASASDGDHQEHAPIRIDGDDDFEDPEAISGVVSGSGTADDPYVIAGWDLHPTVVNPLGFQGDGCDPAPRPTESPLAQGTFHGIEIVGTDAHVVIRDNRITRMDPPTGTGGLKPTVGSGHMAAIYLQDADNVRIEGNEIGEATGRRLHVGICVEGASGLEIVGNTIQRVVKRPIDVEQAPDVRIVDNVVEDPKKRNGIALWKSDDAVVRGNVVSDTPQAGIDILRSHRVEVAHNTVRRAGTDADSVGGIDVQESRHVDVLDNLVEDSASHGVWVWDADDLVMNGNNLQDLEGDALHNPSLSSIDAETNWWACDDGPSHPDHEQPEPCEELMGANGVDHHPPLDAPNPDAGA